MHPKDQGCNDSSPECHQGSGPQTIRVPSSGEKNLCRMWNPSNPSNVESIWVWNQFQSIQFFSWQACAFSNNVDSERVLRSLARVLHRENLLALFRFQSHPPRLSSTPEDEVFVDAFSVIYSTVLALWVNGSMLTLTRMEQLASSSTTGKQQESVLGLA